MCKLCEGNFITAFNAKDHTCLVYDTYEDYRFCASHFVYEGLVKDELVIVVIDEYNEEDLIKDMENLGLAIMNYIEKGQLIISSIKNTYRGTTAFVPDVTLEYWIELVKNNKDSAGIRIMGEATFSLDGRYETLERLIEYEIRVNVDLIPLYNNHQYLCVYNKNLYPANVLKSIIRAHPSYVNGRQYMRENRFFLNSAENLKIHKEEVDLYKNFDIMENSVKINLEKELRIDQERFHYILGCIGDGVWDYNTLENTISISDDIRIKLKKIKNFPKTQIPMAEFLDCIHKEDVERLNYELDRHKKNVSHEIRIEIRLEIEEEGYIWYECHGKSIGKTENGQVVRIVGTFVEIQDRKLTSIVLEKRVQERTAQLLQANKELEAFTHSVSHDLRSPLRSIDGFSKALSDEYDGRLSESGNHYIERIRNATARMNQLINDLLNLSRLNQCVMKMKNVNLSEIVARFADIYHETYQDREIRFLIEPNILAVCDEGLITIALENLLNNACKFTSKHDTATIQFGVINKNEETVYFLKDDGAGFDMEYSNKLFGVFQRLHRNDEFEGNGIGLANVFRVIMKHNGTIWAEGKVEQGATFYFTLGATQT